MAGLFGNNMPPQAAPQAQQNTLGGGAWTEALKGLKPDQVQTLVKALTARGKIEELTAPGDGPQSFDSLRKRRQSFFDDAVGPQQSIGLGVDE